MRLDKTIWQEAIRQYKTWNEAKFTEQVLTSGKKTLIDKWREYEELISLCWKLKPTPGLTEQQCAIEEWGNYYTSICQFEERRKKYGNATSTITT
ncbi:MAG: hypothetical protein AB1632_15165 [Nitrospirota bacterium]